VTKRVTVIVEGCKYIVEVGDLRERPIKATVNQTTYLVQLPTAGSISESTGSVPSGEKREAAIREVDCTSITAPMPGDILEINVHTGQNIAAGDVICVLEAMKMRNLIRSSRAGVIASVDISAGQAVDYGDILVTFE
jgi:biotin carboxyl carrier protein